MEERNHRGFRLGEFALDPETRHLSRHGRPIHLTRRPFQVLLYLIESRDRVVSRVELLDRFWEGRAVYEATLTKCLGAIRRALDDQQDEPRFIETRYGEGYRYIGPCAEAAVEVERMRRVKIVIEEEIHEAAASETARLPVAEVARALPSAQRQRLRRTIALALLLSVLTGSAVFLYRSHARTNENLSAPIRSLAVLPLKNLSGDPAQEYFSDGLTEHLINTLAKIEGLKVISRGSAFTFKGREVDAREAGNRLGVAAILEGSVLRRGDRGRVEVRLVSTEDGRVLWASDTADRRLDDVFALQDEIARHVVAGLSIELSAEGERRLAKRYTENVEAYQAGLKGDYFRNQRTPDGLRKAIESYQQAIALDPRYVQAYFGLASSYYMGIWYIPLEPKEATAKAKAAQIKALEIDNASSDAHVALAGLLWMEWDWAGCLREMERAIESGLGFNDYGYAYHLLLVAGRPDEAVRWIKRSAELDPLSPLVSANVGEILYYARRYDEAIAQCQKTLGLDPNYAMAHTHLGLAYVQKGKHAEAIAAFEKAIALSDRSPDLLARLAHAYAAAGRRAEAQPLLAELTELAKHRHVPPYRVAEIYAALGDKDQAFAHLEQAYQSHAMHLCNLKVEPTLDALRADARFQDLVRRVGLAQ